MAEIYVGTATTLAAIPKADISNGDISYIWLNSFKRVMVYESTSTKATDIANHPYYQRPDDYASAGVWVEDVGEGQPEAWSADQTKTGQLRSTNWASGDGSEVDLDNSLMKLGGSDVDASGSATGIFLGLDSSVYKLYVGDGGNKYIKFDGTDFTLKLTNLTISSSDQAIALNKTGYTDDTTGVWLGLHSSDYKLYIGKDTAYMKYSPTDGLQIRGDIDASAITGGSIVGTSIATAASGQRIVITSEGIKLVSTDATGKYGGFKYGTAIKYGSGVKAWIWNSVFSVPFYIVSNSNFADFHFFNRVGDPSAAAEEGDVCVVSELFKLCTAAGTPGTWKSLAMEAGGTGGAGSAGAGNQYVEINVDGTTYKVLHDGTI